MYKRIVAGVDGSAHAEHALRHAVALAKALGASLRIVHVADMGWLPVAPELGLDLAQIAAALVEEAASWHADLVVLGAHGHRTLERLLLGGTADGVARRATIPVLLVH